MEPASVSTNTSCSRPRSRADGVTIVFGPMKIFSLRVIAARTSFSLTNAEICTGGSAGAAAGLLAASCAALKVAATTACVAAEMEDGELALAAVGAAVADGAGGAPG